MQLAANTHVKQNQHQCRNNSETGIPTELQQIPDLPEEIKLLLGRWHSSAHQIYAKSIAEANKAALIVQQSVIKLAQTKPTKTIEKEDRDELYD